ncbi:MAG: FAD binding domain-containing protein [Chloroflexi bacterium]|nr:FAD binding domain-containing protein [Chloroflexota bacterium]
MPSGGDDLRDFEYLAPRSIGEAVALLQQHGAKARCLAGGTDLVLMMTDKIATPAYVIDIKHIPELNVFEWDPTGGLTIGAAVPFRILERSDVVQRHYPGMAESAGEVGSWQIRNLATPGGNLCTASPSAEIAPILWALDAQVTIAGPNGSRRIPVQQFVTGVRRTALEPEELLVDIRVPPPGERAGSHYIKLKERQKMDIAFVGVAAAVELEPGDGVIREAKIALGAVAPTPIRVPKAEATLRGQRLTDERLEEAGREAADAAKPITDVRASAEYRKEMVHVLTKRAIRQAVAIATQH